MYKPLQYKFRPKLFSEVVGQDLICKSLKNVIILNKIHFSYLFSGQKGVGKTTLARLFAKSINCLNNNNGEPCLKCNCCLFFNKESFLDFCEIDAAVSSNLDNIKNFLDSYVYQPLIGKYKIFLIDEVHMLSKYSFSYLLKLLEEPPIYLKFILVTTDFDKIPDTILSRCIHHILLPIKNIEITKKLCCILKNENILYNNNCIDIISYKSYGSVRDALNITENIISITGCVKDISILHKMFGIISIFDQIFLLRLIKYKYILFLNWFLYKIYCNSINYFYLLNDLFDLVNSIIFYKKIGFIKNHISNFLKLECISTYFNLNFLYFLRKNILIGIKNIKYFLNTQNCFELVISLCL